MSKAGVHLRFRDETRQPDACVRHEWPGFSVECVRINHARAFDYDWHGHSHYLAVHDISLRDGEVAVNDDEIANRANLRDLLTFVPQKARVTGWSDLNGDNHSYAAIFFDPALAESECEQPLVSDAARPMLYFEDPKLCQTMRRIEAIMSTGAEPEPVAAETLGLLAVLQLYPLLGGAFRNRAGHLTLAQQRNVTEFVESRIASAISLSEMAAVAGLSRYHFARSFSRTYGRAPHRYLLLRRISLAASFLGTTDLPVSEIAQRVGFSSPARLSTAFGRTMGQSPTTFRRAIR